MTEREIDAILALVDMILDQTEPPSTCEEGCCGGRSRRAIDAAKVEFAKAAAEKGETP